MYKYEMDPTNIVEDTEQTRFCPQTERRTDGQGEASKPRFQLRWSGGVITWKLRFPYTDTFATHIQACRGVNMDSGATLQDDEDDQTDAISVNVSRFIPHEADVMIACSSVPGGYKDNHIDGLV